MAPVADPRGPLPRAAEGDAEERAVRMSPKEWGGVQPQAPRIETVRLLKVTYLVGRGIDADPIREVVGYFDPEVGEYLFEFDPTTGWHHGLNLRTVAA
jgi:hypothetical protein